MRKEQEKVKELNNKGFSLVEIIIVIAIMAILAGALAPQLIKYIDKSRKSADIQAAQTIATAVNTALADESSYDVASSTKLSDCYEPAPSVTDSRNIFESTIGELLGGGTKPASPKFKAYIDFYIEVNAVNKSFVIYALKSGETTGSIGNELYPTVGKNYK